MFISTFFGSSSCPLLYSIIWFIPPPDIRFPEILPPDQQDSLIFPAFLAVMENTGVWGKKPSPPFQMHLSGHPVVLMVPFLLT
jgi:hypothetical protein